METPPAKRLESPSSPSPHFCLPLAPEKTKGASTQGASLLPSKVLRPWGQQTWHPRSTRSMHSAPLRVLRHQTSPPPLPWVRVNTAAAPPLPGSLAPVERRLRDAVTTAGSSAAVTLPRLFCRHIHTRLASGAHAGGAASCANYPVPCSDSSPSAHIVLLTPEK